MSLSKHIAQNVIWRGSYFLIQFLVTLFLARILGPAEGGRFFLLLNNLSLGVLVLGFSIESALVYLGASKLINIGGLFKMGLLWILAVSLLLLGAGFLFPAQSWISSSWTWAVGFILFTITSNFLSALFQVQHNFVSYNRVMSVVYLLFVLASWLYYQYADGTVMEKNQQIIYLYLGALILQGLLLLLNGIPQWNLKEGFFFNLTNWKILLSYAVKAFAANIIFFLVYRIDYWFVAHYCSKDQMGIYIQVSKLAQAFIILPAFVSTVIFPHTAGGPLQQNVSPILKLSRYLLFVYTIGFILLIALGPWIFSVLYGSAYAGMESVFSALVPGILALSLQTILAAWFAGNNEVGVNIKGAIFSLIIIGLLNWWWVPRWGIMGAAFASSAGYIVYFVYEYIIFHRKCLFAHLDYFMIRQEDHKTLIQLLKSATK